MLQRQSHAPASVYALADHLDGVLAACEDLLALKGRDADLEWFLASVRRYELAAILHVLRARQHAEELRGTDTRIAAVATLFLAGTAAFTEASGAQLTRAVAGEATADYGCSSLGEHFMIGRRVPIGPLTELAAAFLDALEITYVLYESETPPAGRALPVPAGPPPLPPRGGGPSPRP